MSVRTDDAVAAANRAQGFSLRDALGVAVTEGVARVSRAAPPMQALSHGAHGAVRQAPRDGGLHFSLAALNEPAPTAAGPPRVVRAPAGLKLRVDGPRTTPSASVAALPKEQFRPFSASDLGIAPRAPRATTDGSATAVSPGAASARPAVRPGTPLPSAGAPTHAGPARAVANEASRADVMRLTAYVDDLTTRLHSTQSKLEATERHLTRTSQALAAERQAATAKINALHRDVTTNKERADRFKTELSTRPPKAGLNTAKFASSVESALAGDGAVKAYTTQLVELEEKVRALAEAKATLATEVGELSSKRDAAQGEARDAQERLAKVQTTALDLEKGLHEAEDTVKQAEASAEARRERARELLAKAVALEQTAATRISAVMGLTPNAEPPTLAPPVDLLMAEDGKETDAAAAVLAPTLAPAPVPAPTPPPARAPTPVPRPTVVGAAPPTALGAGGAPGLLARSTHPAFCATLPSAPIGALALDAPLALGLTPTGAVNVAGNDPTSQLVAAVITDLKDHFVAIKSHRAAGAHTIAPLVR